MTKLAIITTHPIQYNAPLFKLLHERKVIEVRVFYTWGDAVLANKYDPGFSKSIQWDIPLLEGYPYQFEKNIATDPGSHHFNGINNPFLIKNITDWAPDGMLIFGWSFKSHFKLIRYFHKKIPLLFRGDSTLLRKQPLIKSNVRKFFLKWVYSYIDYALYVGSANKRYFECFGLKENQLVFAPHAIDNNRFADVRHGCEEAARKWRNELGIQPGELTILYAGKLDKIKDLDFIVRLAEHMSTYPVRFILVGNGPLEMSLKQLTAGNKKFIFLDFQNQLVMPVVYRLGDLFILPSKSETWGLGVNEAMACKRGVLVRDTCGSAANLVSNGVNGYIFNANNIPALVDQLIPLIDNIDALNKMGAESLNRIQEYSFVHIASAIELLMAKL